MKLKFCAYQTKVSYLGNKRFCTVKTLVFTCKTTNGLPTIHAQATHEEMKITRANCSSTSCCTTGYKYRIEMFFAKIRK